MGELIHFPSLVIQTINVAIILAVLWKFFFKPYLSFLDEEAKKRAKLQEDIEASSYIVENAQSEASKILDEARIDARKLSADIVENARKEADNIRSEAAIDAENARKKWFADVEFERRNLVEEMKHKVLQLALKMNEKLFGKNEANEQFLKNSHKDISL